MNEFLGCVNDEDVATITFRELFESNEEHLSHKIDHYFEIYDDYYHRFVGKHPNYLEIGVQNGGSLQIASKYFVNGNIYGIDINPQVCSMELGENITTYCFDIKNKVQLEENFKNIAFDAILDDASHINSDIISTFKTLFSKVKAGGVYLAEDLHTSYWPSYGGGYLIKEAAIEYFKHFIDLLNAYYISDNFVTKLTEDDRYVFEWLESITFHDSVVVIKKLKSPRQEPYKEVVSGKIAPILKISY